MQRLPRIRGSHGRRRRAVCGTEPTREGYRTVVVPVMTIGLFVECSIATEGVQSSRHQKLSRDPVLLDLLAING